MRETDLKVNTDALNSDSNELLTEVNSILSLTSKMYDSVQELNSMWKGKANEAFREQFTKDYAKTKKFLNELRKFSQTLSDDSTEYNSCEANVASYVSRI